VDPAETCGSEFCGSRGRTWLTTCSIFVTAASMSVPNSNLATTRDSPSDDVESSSLSPFRPWRPPSIGSVTCWSTAPGEAPAYAVVICACGNCKDGNSCCLIFGSANAPNPMITMASSPIRLRLRRLSLASTDMMWLPPRE